jgi:tetratricopeptide (TPR) repeat protein
MDLIDEALSVAEEARDRFPLSAKSWYDLAMAQTAAEQHEPALSSLQTSFKLAPDWIPVTVALVKAYQRLGKTVEARSLLERAAACHPGAPPLRYLRAEMKWAEGEREAALEDLKSGLRHDESQNAPWGQLLDWCRQLNQPEEALSLAHQFNPNAGLSFAEDLLQSDSQNPQWHLERARFLGTLGQWEPCFEELQESLRRFPQAVDLRDAAAEALGFHGRFDEALAVCRQQLHAGSLDQTLRLRIAQIELAQGNTQTALRQLWEIVEDAPEFLKAWDVLARSFRDLANVEEESRVAQALTRLDPNRPEAWLFLGSIQRQLGETQAAEGAFERALELEPRDSSAPRELFLLHLSEANADKAEEALEQLALCVPYHDLLIGEVLLRSQQKNRNAALNSFRESCRSHLVALEDAIAALDALISCDGKDEAHQVIEAEILRGTASSVTRIAWVHLYAREEKWEPCAQRIDSDFAAEGLWEAMACSYLQCAGEQERGPIVSDYLRTHRERLRRSTQTWSAAGKALADAGLFDEALTWYTGWQNRKELTPLMLHPLAYCYVARRQLPHAGEVSRHALELFADESFEFHQLWCLAEAVMTGDRKTAYNILQEIDTHVVQQNQYTLFLYQLLHLVLTSRVSELTGETTTYREAVSRARGLAAAQPLVQKDPVLRWLYYQGLRRIALDHHRPLAAVYAKLRSRMR